MGVEYRYIEPYTYNGVIYSRGDELYVAGLGWGSINTPDDDYTANYSGRTVYFYGFRQYNQSNTGWEDGKHPLVVCGALPAIESNILAHMNMSAIQSGGTPVTYTISFNANGGSGAPSSVTKTHGVNLTLPSTKPTRSGYTFVGWSDDATDTSHLWDAGGTFTWDQNDTLYAIWKKTITLTYNANGGTGVPNSQSTIVYNATTSFKFPISSTKPTRTGYTFLGWSTSDSATSSSYNSGESITLSSSDTLYAVWEEHKLTIKYYSNNATGYDGTYTAESTVNNNDVWIITREYKYDDPYDNGLLNYSKKGSSLYMYRTGYTATGKWGTSNTGGTYEIDQDDPFSTGQALALALGKDLTKGDASVNLYAQWQENGLTVYYYHNGADYGTYRGESLDLSKDLAYGKTYYYSQSYESGLNNIQNQESLYLSKSGYFSTGYWGTEPNGGTLVDENTPFATGQALAMKFGINLEKEDELENGKTEIILYAQWTPANAVYYNYNGTDIFCFTYGKVDGAWQPMYLYGNVNGNWQKLSHIGHDGKALFKNDGFINYVSLGDSIAAGQAIDENWDRDYGVRSQYGSGENTYTVIVQDSYTDLLDKEFKNEYGNGKVSTISFAHSGDTVANLMSKLEQTEVINAIKKANMVTICIGANDILGCVSDTRLTEYINSGNLSEIEAEVTTNLVNLNNDNSSTSYKALMDKLLDINPKAKYIFTTIYNPYKYLHLDPGGNGFFETLLIWIPDMIIDINNFLPSWVNNLIDIPSYNLADGIKELLLQQPIFQTVCDRVNGLSDWVEKFVDGHVHNFNGLNKILESKITERQTTNPNFILAKTKDLFDKYPNRGQTSQYPEETGNYYYHDLVNVEYTTNYQLHNMDWGQMWLNSNAYDFWWNLAIKYIGYYDKLTVNPLDYFDMEGFANELVMEHIVPKVIAPDIDPHPEFHGQLALKKSFMDAIKK